MAAELLYDVVGDISGFDRAMHLAEQVALRSANQISDSFGRASNFIQAQFSESTLSKVSGGLGNIRTAAVTAAGAFVAFEAAKFVLNAISTAADEARQKLAELVTVGNQARSAGVGTNFLQQWTADAKSLQLEAGKAIEMLNRAREASQVNLNTAGGPNRSQMQDLLSQHVTAGNISQGDLDTFNAAPDQEGRIRAILDLVERLRLEGRALAALNIGDSMFGPDFGNKMRDGVNIITKMREALSNIKDVAFTPDMISRAEDINRQIEQAERRMREGWLPVQQDINRWQQDALQSWADMKSIIADIAELLGGWYTAIKKAGDEISRIANDNSIVKGFADWTRSLPSWMRGGVEDLTDETRAALVHQYQRNQNPQPERPLDVPVGDRSRAIAPPSTTTTAEQTTALETYMNQLQKSISVLEAETASYGKNNIEKAKAVDLAKAEEAARRDAADGKRTSAQLTDEERQKVIALAEAEGRLKDRLEQMQKAQASANEMAQFFGQQLISAVDRIGQSGVKARDVILDLAKALEKAALQAVLLGSGPFAGLFGTSGTGGNTGGLIGGLLGGGSRLFSGGGYGASDYATAAASAAPGMYGPGFEGGGFVGRDGSPSFAPRRAHLPRYDLGGPIPIIAHEGELVLNKAMQRNIASQGGNSWITHSPTYTINGVTPEHVMSAIKAYDQDSQRRLIQRIERAQGRYA